MRQSKITLIAITLGLVVMTFQACSPLEVVEEENSLSAANSDDPAQLARFKAAKAVLDTHCTSCHRVGGAASSARLDFSSEAQFLASGLIVAGKPNDSKLIQRSKYGGTPTSDMPTGVSSYSQQDHLILSNWIAGVTDSSTGLKSQFVCQDPNDIGPSQVQVLTKTQYVNALTDLFGSANVNAISSSLSNVPEVNNADFSGSKLTQVTNDQADGYATVAVAMATRVVNQSMLFQSHFGTCASLPNPSASCLDNTYLNDNLGLAMRIFRRPLTTAEKNAAKAIWNAGGSKEERSRRILAMHLTSPYFLTRLEIGSSEDTKDVFDLTPYEVAARISFSTIESIPDTALLTAARNNELVTREQVEMHVRRLLDSERGRAKVRETFHRWLKIPTATNADLLPPDLKSSVTTAGLDAAMIEEINRYIDYIVWEKNGGYEDLMTSKMSFANHSGLAAIYGHAPTSEGAMMSGRRQGLLMRLPFLAAGKTRSPLVMRGVTFLRYVMCESLPSPTVDIVNDRNATSLTQDQILNMSNLDYVNHLTSSPTCVSCHSKINPAGAAFEAFDSLGRFREKERVYNNSNSFVRELQIRTTASIPLASPLYATDAYDLMTQVAKGSVGPSCMARQVFRSMNQRFETDHDNCALNDMFKRLTTGASIREAFVTAIANDVANKRRKQ